VKIVITGPRSVGKSTISQLVAKALKMKYISSDELGEKACKKYGGLDKAIKSGMINKMIKEKGYTSILNALKKENIVLDLSGGSISSRKFAEASQEIRKVASECALVFGLLPFPDEKKSVKLLFEREIQREHFKDSLKQKVLEETQKDFLKFPALFQEFCNFIVYTETNSPDTVANEIVNAVKEVKKEMKEHRTH